MAGQTYNLAAGEQAAHEKLMTAGNGNHDIVTFTENVASVVVVNLDGAARIYVTLDGTDPTIAGVKTKVVPAAVAAVRRFQFPPRAAGQTSTVKLVSVGAPTYSVEAA